MMNDGLLVLGRVAHEHVVRPVFGWRSVLALSRRVVLGGFADRSER
jgi:hypothetical protein